jgi:hypothetical protein
VSAFGLSPRLRHTNVTPLLHCALTSITSTFFTDGSRLALPHVPITLMTAVVSGAMRWRMGKLVVVGAARRYTDTRMTCSKAAYTRASRVIYPHRPLTVVVAGLSSQLVRIERSCAG